MGFCSSGNAGGSFHIVPLQLSCWEEKRQKNSPQGVAVFNVAATSFVVFQISFDWSSKHSDT